MEIRRFAERVLLSPSLEEKLAAVEPPVTDESPGEPVRIDLPARTQDLRFAPPRTAPGMPHREAFRDPAKRAVAHHVMANHELQALEVMAFVLCAFPDAPAEFRRGMVDVMGEEQRHTRMHVERAAALGLRFGDLPVNGYIWKQTRRFETLLDYLAVLPLVFENANLDHTAELEPWFLDVGDTRGAAVMRTIRREEIGHVAFGIDWLRKLKPHDQSDWDAWVAHLRWPLRPAKARGRTFQAEPRLAAGLASDFVRELKAIDPDEG